MDGDTATMRVVVVRDLHELRSYLTDLEDLAASAMEPNVFYEPWVLFPAMEAFGQNSDLYFLLVCGEILTPAGTKPLLCGFFPFERGRRFSGLPVNIFRLWKYGTAYCGLCTPLIRSGAGLPVLAALLQWMRDGTDRPALIEWRRFSGDGPVYKLLVDFLTRSELVAHHVESRTRSLLCRRSDADEFIDQAYSSRHRSTIRRKQRRLGEIGRLQFRELTAYDDPQVWASDFIDLESSGWKAGEAAALATNAASQVFFRNMIEQGWKRGKVMLLEHRLNGAMIAGLCNLLSAPGSFLYKVAIDEHFAKYSPGELMQMENIHCMHGRAEIEWMDSLAEPSFDHVYHWLDRRTIQSLVWSTGRGVGDFALSVSPVIGWLRNRVGGRGAP